MSSAPQSTPRVSPEQRVFSLILALVTSPAVGRSRDELFQTVYGYAHQYVAGEKQPNLERMFERDKTHIRELGIPLEVVDGPDASGDTKEQRYRVPQHQLQIPKELRFDAAEVRMLAAAAHTWQDSSYAEESQDALHKLATISRVTSDERPRVVASALPTSAAHDAITHAIKNAYSIEFSYRTGGITQARPRKVSPLRLLLADGRWHLIAFDHQQEDFRVFLLHRIRGEISKTRDTYRDDLLAAARTQAEDLLRLAASQSATVRVTPASRAERILTTRGSRDNTNNTITLTTLDYRELARELLSFGNEVRVVSPASLQHHLDDAAQELFSLHGGEPS